MGRVHLKDTCWLWDFCLQPNWQVKFHIWLKTAWCLQIKPAWGEQHFFFSEVDGSTFWKAQSRMKGISLHSQLPRIAFHWNKEGVITWVGYHATQTETKNFNSCEVFRWSTRINWDQKVLENSYRGECLRSSWSTFLESACWVFCFSREEKYRRLDGETIDLEHFHLVPHLYRRRCGEAHFFFEREKP